ncbi:hypothetical protein HWV62_10497 [Athelia sp. TMB]|nr:hypothetical protein HWV62_10497 [Athelia sp. TMB]
MHSLLKRQNSNSRSLEYDKAYKIMDLLQKNISKTNKQEHFLEEDSRDMRLGQLLFEKREMPLESVPRFAPKGNYAIDGAVLLESLISTTPPADTLDSDASNNVEDSATLDDITRTYTKHIPQHLQRNYHKLMKDYVATPFRLYTRDSAYVSPENVESVLPGGLVECHFTLKHYHFRNGEKGSSDEFTAILEQTIWLKVEKRCILSGGYNKRKNPLEGPTQPKVNKAFKSVAGSSASSATAIKLSNTNSSIANPLPANMRTDSADKNLVSVSGGAVHTMATAAPPASSPVEKTEVDATSKSVSNPMVKPSDSTLVSQVSLGHASTSDTATHVPPEKTSVQGGSTGDGALQIPDGVDKTWMPLVLLRKKLPCTWGKEATPSWLKH